jgi:hypothetical protein
MSSGVVTAWRDGIARVWRAPVIVLGAWLLTLGCSLPLALAVRGEFARHLGSSLEADAAVTGVNFDWMQEFTGQAGELGATAGPGVIGFAAVLENISGMLDSTPRPQVVVATIAAYIVLMTFLAGGMIDRLARDRPTRAHGFFAACGGLFARFLRLGALSAVLYGVLFTSFRPWLLDDLYGELTYQMTVERNAFLLRVAFYLAFATAIGAVNVIVDYAKVRMVVEDRRSALGALAASLRFVVRQPRPALSVYCLNVLLFGAVLVAYALSAPGANGNMWVAFAIGQLYVAARLAVKLMFWASETALFQRQLAHAGYVARPLPTWPESPAAEAIARGPLVSGISPPSR